MGKSARPGARRTTSGRARRQKPKSTFRKRPRDTSPEAIDRLLGKQDWARVASFLPDSAGASQGTLTGLRDYCQRVLTWNRTASNLISRNDEGRIVERHVVESLEPAGWLAAAGINDWLDFGSGAGFPAIPLAIAGVGSRWTLVESRRMKALFLRKTVSEMRITPEISIVYARLESLIGAGKSYMGFTARAAGKIGETLKLAGDLISDGGSAFLWKGSRWSEEMTGDRSWEKGWSFVEQRPLSASSLTVLLFTKRNK